MGRKVRTSLRVLAAGTVAGIVFMILGAVATDSRRSGGGGIGDYTRIAVIGLVGALIAMIAVGAIEAMAWIRDSSTSAKPSRWLIVVVLVVAVLVAGYIEIPLLGVSHVHGGTGACEHQGAPFPVSGEPNVQMHWSWHPFGFSCEWVMPDGSMRTSYLRWGDTPELRSAVSAHPVHPSWRQSPNLLYAGGELYFYCCGGWRDDPPPDCLRQDQLPVDWDPKSLGFVADATIDETASVAYVQPDGDGPEVFMNAAAPDGQTTPEAPWPIYVQPWDDCYVEYHIGPG